MAFGRTSLGSTAPAAGDRRGGQRPLSDINMTPLVDVMLVLLVIFIITAPLMASSIKLDLPHTDAAQPTDTPQFVSLAIDAAGKVFLDDQPVDGRRRWRRASPRPPRATRDTEVQLRADQTVPYGRVVELMGMVKKAG